MAATAVYVIWHERNARMHGDSPRPESLLFMILS